MPEHISVVTKEGNGTHKFSAAIISIILLHTPAQSFSIYASKWEWKSYRDKESHKLKKEIFPHAHPSGFSVLLGEGNEETEKTSKS